MKVMIMITTTISLIIMILLIIINMVSKKSFSDREKSSPFECGFDPKSSSRLPFSIKFFLIAIIFLIFDVEITLLFPLIISLKYSNLMYITALTFFFIFVLMIGLVHEWKQGALDWNN